MADLLRFASVSPFLRCELCVLRGGKPAPVIDGLTGEQRLFLGYAQSWRGKARDDALRARMASDPHSPRMFRVIGPTRNVDAWYRSFDVTPQQKYFLEPEDRVRVW